MKKKTKAGDVISFSLLSTDVEKSMTKRNMQWIARVKEANDDTLTVYHLLRQESDTVWQEEITWQNYAETPVDESLTIGEEGLTISNAWLRPTIRPATTEEQEQLVSLEALLLVSGL